MSRLKPWGILALGNIRLTLLVSFLVVTIALLIPTLLFSSLNISIANQYETTLNNMILEYKVADTSSKVVVSYRGLLQNADDAKLIATHTANVNELNSILSQLDKTVTVDASRVIYNRIQNTAGLLNEYLDRGLKNARARNFSQSAEILEQIARSSATIQDDVARLVLADLSTSAQQQKELQFTQNLIGTLGGTLIVLVTLSCVVFAFIFSTRISRPIIKLAQLAGAIDKGHLDTSVQPELLARKDEIGSLSNSFNTMLQRLKGKIKELEVERNIAEGERAKDEAILSSIGDGVIATDNTGTVLIMNKIAENILDLEPGANDGKDITSLLKLLDQDGTPIPSKEHPVKMTLTQGTRTYTYEKQDHTTVSLSVTSTPVTQRDQKTHKDTTVGTITIIRDVTKETEVDRMKTEFISLASHQLRTPLSAIRWFAEMLDNGDAGKLNPEQTEFAKNIVESTERMIELVNSLLNISRMESGRIMIDPQPTDLKEMVETLAKELQVKIVERNQTLVIDVHANLPKINLDPKLIRQVYLNLLTNAIKYTPKGGEISVFISRKGEELISQVTDTGYGIPKAEQGKMFQKFFRASNIAKVETDGTGLGMYLIKAIIEASKGKIWFKSEEGKGTTFWFSLPMSGMEAKKGEVTLNS